MFHDVLWGEVTFRTSQSQDEDKKDKNTMTSNKNVNQTACTLAALRGKFIGAVWLY